MTSRCFTIGIYENQWVYVRLLALEVQKLVKNGTLDTAHILWYKLRDPKFLAWIDAVEKKRSHRHPYPFGECPYILEITGKKDEIPDLEFTGQSDIPPSRVKKKPEPGCFGEECDVYSRPLPNFIVVDHHLFDLDTTGLVKKTSGHAPIILKGLKKYCGDNSQPPPILVSSQKSLAGETGQDTLGFGRGKGSRVSWIPRPQGEPTDPPEGFAKVLQEEVGLWLRNRDLLGVVTENGDWLRYDPPFDHILISYDRVFDLDKKAFGRSAKVLFRDQKLSRDDSDAVIARHCKAYLEVNKRVTQDDVNRLQKLASDYPLPIVLLYWDTKPNVGNLSDCGVLAELVEGSDDFELATQIHKKAVAWTERMAVLDTVVGSKRLVELRDDLLNWHLATQSAKQLTDESKSNRQGMLVVGRTGVGKTGISRWCHFFSTHFKHDEVFLTALLEDIKVPNPALKPNNKSEVPLLLSLGEAIMSTEATKRDNPLSVWLTNMIRERGGVVPDGTLRDLVDFAFRRANTAPLQVNLVGITTHREFIMQIAGAFPSWTGSRGAGDWRPGAVLNATNDSLILNEIGELKGDAQGLLLELIERDGPIRPLFAPIGGEVKAQNVLFIMATDRVDKIREQLFHRCRVLRVPSLLECKQDLAELARHRLLPRWCCLSERAEQLLKEWPYWPGNHRSLHAVLDFAAERLPSDRRVIRVQDLIRALWREDLIRIPARLEILIKWILDWPDLDEESRRGSTLPGVITRLSSKSDEDWKILADNLKRIAKTVFENPSAHFTNLLDFDVSTTPQDNQKVVETSIGLLIHEAFLILEKRIEHLQKAIEKGKEARIEKLSEIVGKDFERKLVNELREDALVVLSLGTLLWDVLEINSAELSKIETLIQSRQRKASGRKSKRFAEDNIEEESDQLAPQGNAEGNQEDKSGQIAKINSRISTVKYTAGAVSLPVVKALDSPHSGSFFDYVEDRRNRMYFSSQKRNRN
jgi:hypothetical protein